MNLTMLRSGSNSHISRLISLMANYMITTEAGYMVGVKKMAFCIAFFIMAGNSPENWLDNCVHRARHAKRKPSVPKGHIEALWRQARDGSSELGARRMNKRSFTREYDKLLCCGAWYVWLADQVGAGSLLFLHSMFPPEEVDRAPKGKDQGGGSDLLRRRLKDELQLDKDAQRFGATSIMNDLMWAMMEELDGVVRPPQLGRFPGFFW